MGRNGMKNMCLTSSCGCKSDLVYIMAPSFTGSTLLTYLLAMHPEIATIGELKASAMGDINVYTCSCGSLIRECVFWQKVCESAEKKGISFSLDKFNTHFRYRNRLCDRLLSAGVRDPLLETIRNIGFSILRKCRNKRDDIILQNRNLIKIITDLQGGSVFLDGSKDPIRLKYFMDSANWNIKVLYLIRDGRGTTNSYMRHNNVPMEIAAKEWVHTHQGCDRMKNMLGDACLTMHYEDLCRDPDVILSKMYDFIGLDADLGSTDFRSVEHHILGNAMRMTSTSGIRLDEKWRQALSGDDLQVFEKIAGKTNLSYGYQ